MKIHPTAVIDKLAKLADDVEVGPYAIIGPGVELQRSVVIASHVVVEGNTAIGEGSRIFTGAVARTFIPYLLKLMKKPKLQWKNIYLVSAVAGIIVSLITATLLSYYIKLDVGFIGGFTLAYTLQSLSRDVQKSLGNK